MRCGQPVQEHRRGPMFSRATGLVGRGVGAAGSLAQSPQHMPDGVAVQQLSLVGVAAGSDGRSRPGFELGQVLVTGRQAPVATSTARRWAKVLLGGSSSSVAWVSGRAPLASSPSTPVTALRDSQLNAVSGRSTPTSAS